MNMEKVKEGFVFQLETSEYTVIFVTDDGYYALVEDETGHHDIFATESIEMFINDGTAEFVRADKIKAHLGFERTN